MREQHSSHLFNTNYINPINLENHKNEWIESKPFNHLIIDNFLLRGGCKRVP